MCNAPGGVISDARDIVEMERFSTFVKLVAFQPFNRPEHALAAIKNISIGLYCFFVCIKMIMFF